MIRCLVYKSLLLLFLIGFLNHRPDMMKKSTIISRREWVCERGRKSGFTVQSVSCNWLVRCQLMEGNENWTLIVRYLPFKVCFKNPMKWILLVNEYCIIKGILTCSSYATLLASQIFLMSIRRQVILIRPLNEAFYKNKHKRIKKIKFPRKKVVKQH